MKKLMALMFVVLSAMPLGVGRLNAGSIDPLRLEALEPIDASRAPSVLTWASTAQTIRDLNLTQEVIHAYNNFKPHSSEKNYFDLVQTDCFAIFIKMKNGVPQAIQEFNYFNKPCKANDLEKNNVRKM